MTPQIKLIIFIELLMLFVLVCMNAVLLITRKPIYWQVNVYFFLTVTAVAVLTVYVIGPLAERFLK